MCHNQFLKEGKAKKKCKQYFPRQRPHKACLSCVTKKIKCSLVFPCHQCQKRGICCEYANEGNGGKTTTTAPCDKAATTGLCIESVAEGEVKAQEEAERVQGRSRGEEEEAAMVRQGQQQEPQQEKEDDEREEEEEEEQECFVPRYGNNPSSLSSSSTSSNLFSVFRPWAPAPVSLPMHCPLYAHEQEEESEGGEEEEREEEELAHGDEDDADREVAFLLEMDPSLLKRHKGRLMRSPPIITHMSVATPPLPGSAGL